MKSFYCVIFIFSFWSSLQSQEDSTAAKKIILDIGGALRYNYNLSTWKPNQIRRGGDFGFEVFRINVDGNYDQWELHIDYRFYSNENGGLFLKYGWFQYNLNPNSHIKVGLIPAYFGIQQFNSHSWFFQLPFYLGFEDDHDMGISYDLNTDKWQLDIGFYKNAEKLGFSDNGPISDSRYAYDFSGRNQEVNQLNLRQITNSVNQLNNKQGSQLNTGEYGILILKKWVHISL